MEKLKVDPKQIAENFAKLLDRVQRLGGSRVQVVAVTKSFPLEAIDAVVMAGCTKIGENYAQELMGKWSLDRVTTSSPEVHFIGQLQSNKVRQLAAVVDIWQTVDRLSLIDEIARRAPAAQIMVQVNATNQSEKGGCHPRDVDKLVRIAGDRGLQVSGLMCIGPTSTDIELTTKAFQVTAELARALCLPELSMGMSNDLEIAIEQGSTLVRVGSAIFGDRPPMKEK